MADADGRPARRPGPQDDCVEVAGRTFPVRIEELPRRRFAVRAHHGSLADVERTRRPLYQHLIMHELVGGPPALRFRGEGDDDPSGHDPRPPAAGDGGAASAVQAGAGRGEGTSGAGTGARTAADGPAGGRIAADGPAGGRQGHGEGSPTVDVLVGTTEGFSGDDVVAVEVMPRGWYALLDFEGSPDHLAAARRRLRAWAAAHGHAVAGPILQVHHMDTIDGVTEQQLQLPLAD